MPSHTSQRLLPFTESAGIERGVPRGTVEQSAPPVLAALEMSAPAASVKSGRIEIQRAAAEPTNSFLAEFFGRRIFERLDPENRSRIKDELNFLLVEDRDWVRAQHSSSGTIRSSIPADLHSSAQEISELRKSSFNLFGILAFQQDPFFCFYNVAVSGFADTATRPMLKHWLTFTPPDKRIERLEQIERGYLQGCDDEAAGRLGQKVHVLNRGPSLLQMVRDLKQTEEQIVREHHSKETGAA